MSTLTHLSDAELDEVTGGFTVVKINANFNLTEQAQENVAVLAIAHQGGAQINKTVQIA